jgi:cell division protease FtsH
MMGTERRSMVMTDEEKELTAYHEAGHAIVGLNVPSHDPIHKATIIPRGRALGLVLSLPERDQLSQTREQLTSKIAMAMGGRVAEELIFGDEKVTNGAASDIQQVTKIARAMVTQFGMSDKLGAIDYANEQDSYLGAMAGASKISGNTQKTIDEEVKRLVDDGYQTAKRILTEKSDDLERLAQGLLEYESLTGDEIRKVLNGEKLDRSDDAGMPPTPPEGSRAAIPKAGKPKRGDDGLEGGPEPQPT